MNKRMITVVVGILATTAILSAQDSLSVAKARGLKWYKQAVDEMEVSAFLEAELATDKALECYAKAGERKLAVPALTLKSSLMERRWDLDGALSCLDAAYGKLDTGMDSETLEVIKKQYHIYNKYGMVDRVAPLFLKVDSLMRVSSDLMVRVECGVILGDNAANAGHILQAETQYKESLRMLEESDKPDEYVNVIYLLLERIRSQELARREYGQALRTSRRMLGLLKDDGAQDLGLAYFNIAEVYQKSGDTTRCLAYADTIMANGGVPMTDPLLEARHLQLKGILNGRLGRWNTAANIYASVDSMMFAGGQNALRERMNLVPLRAAALYQAGRLQESERLYSQYYEYARSVFSEESDATTTALLNLANIRAYCGRIAEGSDDYIEVERRLTEKIGWRLRFLSSESRGHYLDNMLDVAFAMTAFGLKAGHSDDRFAEAAWDALLMAKGLLLASDKDASQIVRGEGTKEDRELFYKLTSLQRTLASMEGRPGSDPVASAELCREILAVDSRLAGQCAAYSGIGSFLRTDADAVKAALSDNDVIVDMFDYKSDDGTHPYVAYIVRKESSQPLLVRLCENVRSGDSPMDFRDALEASEVKAFVERLSSMLRPGDNIFLVPSGDFHLIPVESVVMPDGRRFGEAFNITRLSSARDAVAFKQGAASTKKRMEVCLFGGLDYGPSSEYSPLPATSEELAAIRKALGKKAKILEYTGEEGTWEAVMGLDGNSPDILHFATHGFWYSSDGPSFNKAESYRRGMNMSGLILSGGQRLTASDISTLDLSGTSLAVLSACQTGQGHITPEGVFGLQRAFKKAGVRHILVNIGEASDVASSLFMKEFYSSLKTTGDAREAFAEAKAAVQRRYPDPFYWAGFLLLD